MRGETAQLIESPAGAATPAVVASPHGESSGICLAAGHSDEAAQRVAGSLTEGLSELAGPPSASALAELLRAADRSVGPNASVTAAVVVVTAQRVFGALAGRARALLVGDPDEVIGEGRGAGVGSGRVHPVAFNQPLRGRTLIVGTESVFQHASDETLFNAARGATPGRVAARLAEFARDEHGALGGAIALWIHRPAPASTPPQPARAPGRPRILFAEAHSGFVRSVARSVLADFEVVAHGRVTDALDAVTADTFDLALVDYDLADETGDVLVRALRERGFAAPIIAVSAKDSANEALVEAGANRACSKLAFGQIAEVIRSLLVH